MMRREFLALLGAAGALLPLPGRAQKVADMPVIGFLHAGYPQGFAEAVGGFRRGLSETGYVEGKNCIIEYRWALGQYNKLPTLAAELVRAKPGVVFASSPPAARAFNAENSNIPIVFAMGEDPVQEGLVQSFSHPGGRLTGFSWFSNQLYAKRLGLLTEIAPYETLFGFLTNPKNPNSGNDTKEVRAAALQLGKIIEVFSASALDDLEVAFSAMGEQKVSGIIVGVDGLFLDRREQVIALANRYSIPAIYDRRQYCNAGGLMCYGASQVDAWRQAGIYVGRILMGEQPGDLPVQRSTKSELVVNLKSAEALGVQIPSLLQAQADEVIE